MILSDYALKTSVTYFNQQNVPMGLMVKTAWRCASVRMEHHVMLSLECVTVQLVGKDLHATYVIIYCTM